jgi:comEA protein
MPSEYEIFVRSEVLVLMQKTAMTLFFAVVTVVLLAALLLAIVPPEPETDGWRSVNGEMRDLLDGGNDAGPAQSGENGGTPPEQPEAEEATVPAVININTATAEQLDLLPGIGPAKARAIIEYRETYGRFETPEQLMEVKGIGQKTFERLKDLIEL